MLLKLSQGYGKEEKLLNSYDDDEEGQCWETGEPERGAI